jgi:hypothetical protein
VTKGAPGRNEEDEPKPHFEHGSWNGTDEESTNDGAVTVAVAPTRATGSIVS